ncbi:hypothetical protein LINGRAHAP2_LOCUS17790 [Linum grandiflorum]
MRRKASIWPTLSRLWIFTSPLTGSAFRRALFPLPAAGLSTTNSRRRIALKTTRIGRFATQVPILNPPS